MNNNGTSFILARPTVVIGVGGTGVNSIRRLKSLMGEHIPPQIRFLGIDTTEQNPNNDLPLLDTNEFVSAQVIEPDRYVTRTIHKTIKDWWPSTLEANKAIMRGAGQVRARGRLALFINAHKINQAIQNQIDTVISINPEQQRRVGVNSRTFADIYIISSLCGGTGSGMFLDISLMVRNALKHHQGQIRGIFVLPSIFKGKPGTDWVLSNTYASLIELDHLMSVSPSRAERVTYSSDFKIDVENPPFDRIYLLDNQNEGSGKLTEIFAMNSFIADVLFLMINSEFTSFEDDQFKNMETSQRIRKAQGHKNQCYSSLGISYLKATPNDYNLEEVVKARRIIDNLSRVDFSGAGDLINLDKDVEFFYGNNKLAKKDILSALTRNVRKASISLTPISPDYTQDMIQQISEEDFREGKFDHHLDQQIKMLSENFETNLKARINQYFTDFGSALLAEEFSKRLLKKVELNLSTFGIIRDVFFFKPNGNGSILHQEEEEIEIPPSEAGGFFNWIRNLGRPNTDTKTETTPKARPNHNTEYRQQYVDFRFQKSYDEACIKLMEAYRHILANQANDLEEIGKNWARLAYSLSPANLDLEEKTTEQQKTRNPADQFKVSIPLLPEFKASWRNFVSYSGYNLDWKDRSPEELWIVLREYIRKEYEESGDHHQDGNSKGMVIQAINRMVEEDQEDLLKWKFDIAYRVATPLWTFSEASLEDRKSFERILFIGVPENFSQEKSPDFNIKNYVPLNESRCDIIPMHGRRGIIFMRHVVGLPAFAVADDKPWAENYWQDSRYLESHIWPNPWTLEDIMPYEEHIYKLVGKAQAYGLIDKGVKPVDTLKEMLTGHGISGSLFDLYSDILGNTTHKMLEYLEAMLEVFETGEKLEDRLTDEQIEMILKKRSKNKKQLKTLINEHIEWIQGVVKRPKTKPPMETPVRRFYSKMKQYLEDMNK